MTPGDHVVDDQDLPVFFLSYGHAHALPLEVETARNDRVSLFFNDLSADVGELVGRAPNEYVGFMDQTFQGGEDWVADLTEALGGCQVFIPLISSSLVASSWCGMEWDGFTRRRVIKRDTRVPVRKCPILPVIWTPLDTVELPTVMDRVQRFSPQNSSTPALRRLYLQEGIYGLLNLQPTNAYREVVWRLARRVVDLHRRYYVEPLDLDSSELRNVFAKESSR
ncbi:TIR-like protein FxsC [Catellatospora methionotrophica]|uniref:TIR-like protein FxsC n=1 Tax=Catellatospora methionotrophica TaxID=121620 RepID=UPI0033CC67AF